MTLNGAIKQLHELRSAEDMINTVKVVMNYLYKDVGDTWYGDLLSDVLEELMNNSDAEPVIRCKDCKFFDHSDFGKGEEYWCKHFVSTDDYTHCHKVTEDGYCSWGEKREDETVHG